MSVSERTNKTVATLGAGESHARQMTGSRGHDLSLPLRTQRTALASVARVAVICDYREEQWPSMERVADMLLAHLKQDHSEQVAAARLCPTMRRRFTRLHGASRRLFNADRLMNRFWDYRRWLNHRRDEFELFHIIDHSYAQLVHELPHERTVVTCHDLDTFRCLLEPQSEQRSGPYRAMTRRILSGLQRAARVTCDSFATRDQLLAHELLPPERVVVVHNGVSQLFSPRPDEAADREATRLLRALPEGAIVLLHVGSTIARKRVDILLRVFAAVRVEFPQARLVRVGGALSVEQRRLVARLGLEQSIIELPFLTEPMLAAVYRRADLLLQPSEAEGFGLPVVEAMACGTMVVASNLPVLREVGGEAAHYCEVEEVRAWGDAIARLLVQKREEPEPWATYSAGCLAQASKFSWAEYANRMVALYRELL